MIDRLYRDKTLSLSIADRVLPRWLDDVLHRAMVTDEHVAGFAVWCGASPLVAVIAWWLVDPVAAALSLVVAFLLPMGVLARRLGRRRELAVDALPETVDAISRALRSGASFSQSIAETANRADLAIAEELGTVLAAIEMGMPSEQALWEWAERMPDIEVEMVAAAFALAHQFEAAATQALDGVAQSLRDRADLQNEVRALTAQASASLRAMVLLPAGFLFLDAVTGRTTLDYLTGEDFGRVCLAVGVVLNLSGWWWMVVVTRQRLLP